MTSTRGKWLRSSLSALVILVAPASTSTVWAQGGFGADPFRPYNSQYDAYTYPTASPDMVPSAGGMPRMGIRGANQYQGYLDELAGSGRQSERYGIGVPYYRSAVDPSFDPKGDREYRPNGKADRTYEHTQEVITRKYLAYFAEKDPKKRAELLKDYNRVRSNVSRAMSARREDPTRVLEAATADNSGERKTPAPDREAGALPGTADRRPGSPSARRSVRTLPSDDGTRAVAGLDSTASAALPWRSQPRNKPAPPTLRSSGSFAPAQFEQRSPIELRWTTRGARLRTSSTAARTEHFARVNETASSLTRPLQALQYSDRDHSGGRPSA